MLYLVYVLLCLSAPLYAHPLETRELVRREPGHEPFVPTLAKRDQINVIGVVHATCSLLGEKSVDWDVYVNVDLENSELSVNSGSARVTPVDNGKSWAVEGHVDVTVTTAISYSQDVLSNGEIYCCTIHWSWQLEIIYDSARNVWAPAASGATAQEVCYKYTTGGCANSPAPLRSTCSEAHVDFNG